MERFQQTERGGSPVLPTPEEDRRRQIPSVSQLNRKIRGQLERSFLDVWVRGEISSFRRPGSGHGYMILKDETAQLRCVMFRPHLSRVKFEIQDGMEVLVHGRITVYEARGDYQLVADTLEPVGVGALQKAFEQLKGKLQKEGLFDKAHKKPLPFLPKRIGVITSATGAAVRDILKVLSSRFSEREVLILPASVQGQAAAGEIVSAIESAQRWNRKNPDRAIDVLIVGRGGGSLEDLWPFNEEIVARALYDCDIPTLSAVGHEIDFTISDFVADLRAPTPSAAAEMVIPKRDELEFQVSTRVQRLHKAMSRSLEQKRMHVDHLSQRLMSPQEKLEALREKILSRQKQMFLAMRNSLQRARARFEGATHQLHLLSPLEVISRGYTLTWDGSGHLVKSIEDVSGEKSLVTRVKDGLIRSEILSTEPQAL